jgi:hypothetical protein
MPGAAMGLIGPWANRVRHTTRQCSGLTGVTPHLQSARGLYCYSTRAVDQHTSSMECGHPHPLRMPVPVETAHKSYNPSPTHPRTPSRSHLRVSDSDVTEGTAIRGGGMGRDIACLQLLANREQRAAPTAAPRASSSRGAKLNAAKGGKKKAACIWQIATT